MITTIRCAPASTAMSRFVVDTMPPSISSRSLTRTGEYTIGSAPEARTAVDIGTSSEPSDAEHHPLAGVEVRGRDVQLAGQLPEVVGAARLAEHLVQVVLDPGARVQAGR